MASPDPIPPDDKDWTWVLQAVCPECGFNSRSVECGDVAALVRANAEEWQSVLGGPARIVKSRPYSGQWSALEYGAHVRDVNTLYLERLELMLTQEGPRYPNWDQDATAISSKYHEDDPMAVADEITRSANALADRFDTVENDEWQRTGYRSDGAAFTVASFARYFIHDPIHHLYDVRAGFDQLSE